VEFESQLHQFVLRKGDIKKKVRLAKGKAPGSQTSLTLNNRELKQATFLSQGRKPEVNIFHARAVVSPRLSN